MGSVQDLQNKFIAEIEEDSYNDWYTCSDFLYGDRDIEGYEFVEEVELDQRRWCWTMMSIFTDGEKFFAVEWDRGFTENNENGFFARSTESFYEVEPKQITITEYKRVR